MNQDYFNKRDYVIVIFATIFISFGITIPLGILLFIFLISSKINHGIRSKNENKTLSTSFIN